MNSITLQPNASIIPIRSMYGWNVAHDAMQVQGAQCFGGKVCKCGVDENRSKRRV